MNTLPGIAALTLLFTLHARAGLEFEQTEIKHTARHGDTEVSKEFKFKVTGGKPVKILDIATYCGCLKAKIKGDKMEFKDGEEGVLETAFTLGTFEGEVSKQVAVTTDDPAQREVILSVRMTIPQIFKMEPESVKWDVGEEPKAKTIKVTVLDEKEIAITKVESTRVNMTAEFKEVKKGREYQITFTPKTTAEPMMGVLTVETDAPYSRYRKRLLFFNVLRPKATVSPKQ